ncbi:MAG: ABC transporter substrate-binding protein [Acidiferrobacterales bacterium]
MSFFASNNLAFAQLGIELQPSRKLGAEPEGKETQVVRIAQQYGVAYLPMMIMRQHRLIEKHTTMARLGNVRVVWNLYPSGKVMNDALRAGLLDIASGGVVPLLRLWDETRERAAVKGVAALSSMPLYLNTRNPNVKTIKDFTDDDRIALPAVKKSIQAVILQMAAEQVFGQENYAKLDKLTVSMAHPNAREALLAGKSNITAHLTSPPFQYQELSDPNINRVLSSYDVLGGPATFTVMWTRSQFRAANPKTFDTIYGALKEAMTILKKDYGYAAEVYIQQANSGLSPEFVTKVLSQPHVEFTVVPLNIMKYAKFLYRTGQIKRVPVNWKEVFFPEIRGEAGS